MASRVTAEDRAELEGLLGTGEELSRADYDAGSEGVVLVLEIEGRYAAPIVGSDQPTPDAPTGPVERMETRGGTLEEALSDAKIKLRDRSNRIGPMRRR